MIIFTSFGCMSMSYFIDIGADASGKGTIFHTFTVPNIGEKGASTFDSYIETLHKEGWENIEIYLVNEDQVELTATYRLDHEAGRGIPDSIKGITIVVEESDIGYKYFTLKGEYDFTELHEFWKGLDDPSSKFSVDLGKFLGGQKIEMPREEVDKIINKFGVPKIIYKVKLPGNTPVDAIGFWKNKENYLNGQTDIIEFSWSPEMNPIGQFSVSRRWEPKVEITEEQIKQNLAELLSKYQQEIPRGWYMFNILELPLSGWVNNLTFAHLDKEAYTCGSYQNYMMDFLDGIRTNSDPEIRNLLNGLDYGPIQTNGGGHVAVVVYPSGSDWRQTGTVLDPWPTQKPQHYDINIWFLNLGFFAISGYSPEVTFGEETAYPHLSGKPSSYPATEDLSRKRAQPVRQILVINSPVTVMLKMEDGSLVGVNPDGTGVNQIPWNASFYALPKENGEHSWIFFLPDQTAEVSVYGQSTGTVHTALVNEDGITSFGPQEIVQGETISFSIKSDANLSPMIFADGHTVISFDVQRDEFLQVMGIEENVEVEFEDSDSTRPQPPTSSVIPEFEVNNYQPSRTSLAYAILGLCCCSIIILAVIVLVIFYKKRT